MLINNVMHFRLQPHYITSSRAKISRPTRPQNLAADTWKMAPN